MININENTNRVLNIVKAKHGLKDKSEAIDLVAQQYEEKVLEQKLRPEYTKKLDKIMKGRYYTQEEFNRRVEGDVQRSLHRQDNKKTVKA